MGILDKLFKPQKTVEKVVESGDYKYTLLPGEPSRYSVVVRDNSKETYPPFEAQINGIPVTCMSGTYMDCKNMKVAPPIPSCIKDMSSAYNGCDSLEDISKIVIPSGVKSLHLTFANCTSLTDISNLIIPGNIESLPSTFSNCTSLTTTPIISNEVKYMEGTFSNCTSLADLSTFKLPDSVTHLNDTFSGCTSLTKLPNIPHEVYYMTGTFSGCTSLVGSSKFTIPNSVESIDEAFAECKNLRYLPDMSIANNVRSMSKTFAGCSSLEYANTFTIPSKVLSAPECFKGCTLLRTLPIIKSERVLYSVLRNMFSDCPNLSKQLEDFKKTIPLSIADKVLTEEHMYDFYDPENDEVWHPNAIVESKETPKQSNEDVDIEEI